MRYILRYDDLNESGKTPEMEKTSIALRDDITLEVAKRLAKDRSILVRSNLASNSSVPEEVLVTLSKDSNSEVLWNLAKNPATPPEALRNACQAKTKDSTFIDDIARHLSTPEDILISLATTSENDVVLNSIACREKLSDDVVDALIDNSYTDTDDLDSLILDGQIRTDDGLEKILDKNDYDLNLAMTKGKVLPEWLQRELLSKGPVVVRALVRNPRTDPNLIDEIAKDPEVDQGVLRVIAENESTLTETLVYLLDHEDSDIIRSVKANLAGRDITDSLFDMAEPLDEASLKYVRPFSLDEDMYDEYYQLQENGPALLSDPNTTSEELEKIDVNELQSVQAFLLLINHPNCPASVFDKDRADEYSVSYKIELAKHSKTPASTLLMFSKNQYSADLLIEVSKNPNSTESTQINLVDHTARHEVWKNILTTTDPSSKVLMAMALRMSKDYNEPNSIDIMSKDVCKLIGNSKNLSEKAKDALLNSNKFEAREAAVYCKNLSNEDLLRLASDKTDYVRLILAGNDEANYPEVIWKKLLSDKDIGVRISLATNDKTPTDILIELLEDREKSVVKAAKANLAKRDVTDTLFDAADLIEESKLKYIKENVSPENSRSISNELLGRIQTTKDPVFLDKAAKSNNYWILAAAIENGKLNREQIDRILVNADSHLKSLLSYYCKIEKDQLSKFDECSHCPVALSSNIKSSPDLLIELGKLNRSEIDLQLVNNENSPSELIEEVARRGNIDVLRSLVEMSRTTWKVLDIIADRFIELIKNGKPNMWILGKLTNHRSISTDILLKLADIEAANVADYLLTANKSGKTVHLKLAKQESIDVKLECAKHTKFIEVLDELAMSDDPKVIRFLIEHRAKSMSTKSLLILLDSANDEAAKKIKKELATRDVTDDLFDTAEALDEGFTTNQVDTLLEDPETPASTLEQLDIHEMNGYQFRNLINHPNASNSILIAATAPDVRELLKDILAASAKSPVSVLDTLARSTPILSIKNKIAANPNTSRDTLIYLAGQNITELSKIIVKRSDTPSEALDIILQYIEKNLDDIQFGSQLIVDITTHKNLSRSTRDRIIASKEVAIKEGLAGRLDLSDEEVESLMAVDEYAIRRELADNESLSQEAYEKLSKVDKRGVTTTLLQNPKVKTSIIIDILGKYEGVLQPDDKIIKLAKKRLAKEDVTDSLFDDADLLDESRLKYIKENLRPETSKSITDELKTKIKTTTNLELLDNAARSNNYWIVCAAIESGKLNREQTDHILIDADSHIKGIIAYYCIVEKEQLPKFDECSYCLVWIAENPAAKSDTLEELAKLNIPAIDLPLSKNPGTPDHVLEALAKKGSADIHQELLVNQTLPLSVLEIIVDNITDETEKEYATSSITKIVKHDAVTVEILSKLANTNSIRIATEILGYDEVDRLSIHFKLSRKDNEEIQNECAIYSPFEEVLDELSKSKYQQVLETLVIYRLDELSNMALLNLLESLKSVTRLADVKKELATRDITDDLFDLAEPLDEAKKISNSTLEEIETTDDLGKLDDAVLSSSVSLKQTVTVNPNLSLEHMWILVKDDNVRTMLCINAAVPDEIVNWLIKEEPDALDYLSQNPKISPKSLAKLANMNDRDIAANVAGNLATPPDIINSIVRKYNRFEQYYAAANNPRTPESTLDYIVDKSKYAVILVQVSINPNTGEETLLKLSKILKNNLKGIERHGSDDYTNLAEGIVGSPNVTEKILLELAKINDDDIDLAIINSAIDVPINVHMELTKHDNNYTWKLAKYTPYPEVIDELVKLNKADALEEIVKKLSTISVNRLIDWTEWLKASDSKYLAIVKKELATRDVTDDLFDTAEPLDESDYHELDRPWKDRENENELDDANKQIRSRIRIASDRSTPPNILHELITDATYEVLHALAKNPNTQPEDLRRLGKMEDVGIKENLARNHSTPLDVIEEVSETDDEDILRYVVKRPELNTKIIETVISNCTMIRHADILVSLISRHYSTIPKKNIERLIDIKLSKIDEALAGQSLSDEHYRTLIDRDDVSVLKTIASSHKTSKSILKYLATNGSPLTKIHVVINPSTPTSVLIDLLEDQSVAVKDAAKSVLAKRDISDDLFDIAEPLDESRLKYIRPFN